MTQPTPDAIGEEAIIQRYFAPLAANYPGAFRLRDDAAAITPPPGHDIVVTVDAIAAGVHFFPDDPPASIGWKALAVNVSDLIAKGAAPHAYVMSLAFPTPPDPEWLAQFASGLALAQELFAIHLIGGDTDRRPGPLSITITAFGLVPTGQMVRRGTARVGDHIFVSGTLGDSALGLKLRSAAPQTQAWLIDEGQRSQLIARYQQPKPRLGLAPILRAHARAAMDISDGLIKDLTRMTALSGVGALVHADRLPTSQAVAQVLATDPTLIALIAAGGDDYEVLAAIAPDKVAAFQAAADAGLIDITEIGHIVDGSSVTLLDAAGRPIHLPQSGYDHF